MISASVKFSGGDLRSLVRDAVRDVAGKEKKESAKDAASRALDAELARQREAVSRADKRRQA